MAKRRSATRPATKNRAEKLETVFPCPFCNHASPVECRIDLKHRIGEASCGICQERFTTTANALTEPVDVYSDWIDECEKVNRDK